MQDTESQAVPDSTTEPPKPLHDFQEGDDVFFQTDDGQNILGTVGQASSVLSHWVQWLELWKCLLIEILCAS